MMVRLHLTIILFFLRSVIVDPNLMPFIWVALAIPVLIFLQRWIHMHLHGIALMLTGKSERAVILYALVLLPGVFLHELSHWLSATL
ncbi:MAG: hypothetical protein DWQ04_03735, partial [Chloroflexi bacterium]